MRLKVSCPKCVAIVVAGLSDANHFHGLERVKAGTKRTDRLSARACSLDTHTDMAPGWIDLRSGVLASRRHGHKAKIFGRHFNFNGLFVVCQSLQGAGLAW